VDRNGAGRGAWLCRESPECLQVAVRRHGFGRSFKEPVGDEDAQRLAAELVAAWGRAVPDVRG
jgi:predicted RNA-binding protein YlxR (DUF448 family)